MLEKGEEMRIINQYRDMNINYDNHIFYTMADTVHDSTLNKKVWKYYIGFNEYIDTEFERLAEYDTEEEMKKVFNDMINADIEGYKYYYLPESSNK